jgi:hypothetical protein
MFHAQLKMMRWKGDVGYGQFNAYMRYETGEYGLREFAKIRA